MKNHHHFWLIVLLTFLLTACGGPKLSKLPPPYEEPIRGASNSQSDSAPEHEKTNPEPEPQAEVVVPKVEPINPSNTKPYTVLGESYAPMKEISTFIQKGYASWYGRKFHGRKTANGEIYNMYKLSAAHKTLPIPSYVQVTNEHNQKSIIVRVNDRGPFIKGRIIDLSYAAAKKLDMLGHGTIPVSIQLVDPKNPDASLASNVKPNLNSETELSAESKSTVIDVQPNYQTTSTNITMPVTSIVGVRGSFVQLGAFKAEQNADGLCQRISQSTIAQNSKVNKVYNGYIYQVLLGPYAEYEAAKQVSTQVRDQLQLSSMVFSQ